MIKYINSLENKLIKYTDKLKNVKFSKQEGKFIVEGEHLLEMSINNIDYIITNKPLNNYQNFNQYIVNDYILEKLSENKSYSKIIAVVKINETEIDLTKDIIYLENVQDPGNVGTIFRTALAFNFKNVVSNSGTSYQYSQKVIQASQGSIFSLNLKRDDINYIKNLKENYNYKIIVTTLSNNSINIKDFKKNHGEKYIIVFGNEGQGITKEINDIANYRIKIDISNIDSLNVGVASGITLFSLKN